MSPVRQGTPPGGERIIRSLLAPAPSALPAYLLNTEHDTVKVTDCDIKSNREISLVRKVL